MDRTYSLLLVEDNPADIIITRRALEQSSFSLDIQVVRDGQLALERLTSGDESELELPSLMLLDINLPRLSGLQLLRLARNDPRLQRLPIIVYTTSTRMQDIHEAYRAGANSFFTKPNRFDELVAKIEAVLQYWFGVVRLPANSQRVEGSTRE